MGTDKNIKLHIVTDIKSKEVVQAKMTDVCSVVAQLKLTPKGKLRYGQEFSEIDLLAEFSKLCISPHAIKNCRIEDEKCDISLEEKPEPYSNYFTPQKGKKSPLKHVCSPNKDSSKEKPKEKQPSTSILKANVRKTEETVFNFIKPCDDTQIYIRNIDEEYHDRSKEMGNSRLQDYYARILKFDSEHATSIEKVERNSLIKQNEEVKQINEDQNRASEELAYYQALIEQRESVASEKLRQAEIHRKEIEAKIKKDSDLKRERLE